MSSSYSCSRLKITHSAAVEMQGHPTALLLVQPSDGQKAAAGQSGPCLLAVQPAGPKQSCCSWGPSQRQPDAELLQLWAQPETT